MSMPDPAEPPAIGLPDELARVVSATYQGRDPDNLVTAVVDGDGMVVTITFATTIDWRQPDAAAKAVEDAVSTAQHQLVLAMQEASDAIVNPPTDADDPASEAADLALLGPSGIDHTPDVEPLGGGLEAVYEGPHHAVGEDATHD